MPLGASHVVRAATVAAQYTVVDDIVKGKPAGHGSWQESSKKLVLVGHATHAEPSALSSAPPLHSGVVAYVYAHAARASSSRSHKRAGATAQ